MHSPWRTALLGTDADDAGEHPTLFARFAAEPERDEEHLVLWRGRHVFAFLNRFPYNNGHVLVAPYRVVTTYVDLTEEERHELADALERVQRWQQAALAPGSFNMGMNVGAASGAGLPDHLHAHVVPRWSGDTNFTAATADLKVIPEALEATYRKLRQAAHDDAEVMRAAEPASKP